MHRDTGAHYCSLCLMYATPWGEQAQTQIRFVVSQIELRKPALQRDVHSFLSSCSEADDVLGVVVLSERVAQAHA